jgi:spoIIIJ-associated protein
MADSERQELVERAVAFATGLAAASGLDVTASVRKEEPDGVTIAFDGEDARWLVGRGGQALDALQHIALLAIHRRGNQRFHVTFDADNYRVRREQTLVNLANELAAQVVATGQEAVLDPLSPMERRIVHQVLTENTLVRTYSEGEEPERYIVIAPA